MAIRAAGAAELLSAGIAGGILHAAGRPTAAASLLY